MKKKRKNKQIPFDEFYSNGFLELGRMGNIVSLKNNFTEQTILDKGIMPSEKVLDFPVDCNTLTGSVNL